METIIHPLLLCRVSRVGRIGSVLNVRDRLLGRQASRVITAPTTLSIAVSPAHALARAGIASAVAITATVTSAGGLC